MMEAAEENLDRIRNESGNDYIVYHNREDYTYWEDVYNSLFNSLYPRPDGNNAELKQGNW